MSDPPLNKRLRRDSSSDGKSSFLYNNLEEGVENFQKEAILRQLLEYKRESAKSKDCSKQHFKLKEERDEQIGIALSEIQLVYDLIESLFDELGGARELRTFDPLDLLRDLLENKLDSSEFKKHLSEQRSSTLSLFGHLRSSLPQIYTLLSKLRTLPEIDDLAQRESQFSSLLQNLSHLLKDYDSSKSLNTQLSELNSLSEKLAYLESTNIKFEASIKSRDSELEILQEDLKVALKKIDRLQMTQNKKAPVAASDNTVDPVTSENLSEPKMSEKLKNTYLKEIKELRDEKAQIQTQYDILKSQINDAPPDLVKSSHIYKDTLIQANHFEHEYLNQLQINESLRAELDAIKAEKSDSWERILADEEVRRTTLESQLKTTLADLARVRKHRDNLGIELKTARSKDSLKQNEKSEMLKNLSNLKELIKYYQSELHRLKMKIAFLSNDTELIKQYQEHSEYNSKENNSTKIRELEKSICPDSTFNIKESESDPSSGLRREISNLKEELASCQKKLFLFENSDKSDVISQLLSKEELVKKLQSQCDFYSKSEAQLAQEIEQLGTAYCELTENQNNGVIDLSHHEDQISQLVKEKIKFEKKVASMSKEFEQSSYLNEVLKKQSVKFQEHIRQLDEQIKNLSFQIKTMERDINTGLEVRSRLEEKLKSTSRAFQESKTQHGALVSRLAELEISLTERTQGLEEEKNNQLRLKDELALLQDRLSAFSDVKKVSHKDDISVTLEQYKQLLKCTSCSLRFKSHALIKCMHVFCKQCIDDRLETRQRKCPSCNDPFGANDVKQIYL